MSSAKVARCPRPRAALPLQCLALLLLRGCGAVPVPEGLRGRQGSMVPLRAAELTAQEGSAGKLPGALPLAARGFMGAPNGSLVQHIEASSQTPAQTLEISNRSQVHELEAPLPAKSKIALTLLELFLLGLLGVDRCYMGQCCLGVLKGVTLGALGVWLVIDWVVVVLSALSREKTMDNLGYRAEFAPDEVVPSFWLAIAGIVVIALLTLLGVYLQTRARLFVPQEQPEKPQGQADAWQEVYESMRPEERGIPVSALRSALRDRRWSEADIRKATAAEKHVTFERFKTIMMVDSPP